MSILEIHLRVLVDRVALLHRSAKPIPHLCHRGRVTQTHRSQTASKRLSFVQNLHLCYVFWLLKVNVMTMSHLETTLRWVLTWAGVCRMGWILEWANALLIVLGWSWIQQHRRHHLIHLLPRRHNSAVKYFQMYFHPYPALLCPWRYNPLDRLNLSYLRSKTKMWLARRTA